MHNLISPPKVGQSIRWKTSENDPVNSAFIKRQAEKYPGQLTIHGVVPKPDIWFKTDPENTEIERLFWIEISADGKPVRSDASGNMCLFNMTYFDFD